MVFPIAALALTAFCGPSSPPRDIDLAQASADTPPPALTMAELVRALPLIEREECPRGSIDPVVVEFHRRLSAGARPTDDEWRTALLRAGVVRWRHECWTKHPFYDYYLHLPAWLPGCTITMTPQDERVQGSAVGFSCNPDVWCRYAQELPEGQHKFEFDITIAERPKDPAWWCEGSSDVLPRLGGGSGRGAFDGSVLWSGTLALDVRVSSDVESVVRAVRSASVADAVRASLCVSIWTDAPGAQRETLVQTYLAPLARIRPELKRVVVALDVEVLHCGQVVERAPASAAILPIGRRDCDRDLEARNEPSATLKSIPTELETNLAARRDWSLRFTGAPWDALYESWAEAWWDGSFTISLDELIENGARLRQQNGR